MRPSFHSLVLMKNIKMEAEESIKVNPQKLNSSWTNFNTLGIIVAVIAIIITFILFSLYKKSRGQKNGVLLLGICDAGKTLIFSRLVYKKYVQTQTSVKENIGDYINGPIILKIIDIPGHERLRSKFLEQFKLFTRGLVFVVDSLTIQKDIKDVAEFLYSVLTDNYISSYKPPILILCNKQGETLAKGSNIIKSLLEKEIDILRTTQTKQLESLGKSTSNVFLGKEGRNFEFSHLSPMKVEFAECSAIVGQNKNDFDLDGLEEWMKSLI